MIRDYFFKDKSLEAIIDLRKYKQDFKNAVAELNRQYSHYNLVLVNVYKVYFTVEIPSTAKTVNDGAMRNLIPILTDISPDLKKFVTKYSKYSSLFRERKRSIYAKK